MKKEKTIIISILITLISFLFLGVLIQELLLQVNIIDDYGYIGSSYFEWLYNLFHNKDGLYNAPNLFYYAITFIITFLIIYNLLNKLIRKKSTSNQ